MEKIPNVYYVPTLDSAEDSNRQRSRLDEAIETLKIIDELERKSRLKPSLFQVPLWKQRPQQAPLGATRGRGGSNLNMKENSVSRISWIIKKLELDSRKTRQ